MSNKNTNELKRGLTNRHMNMLAIGGSIGTGLFVGLGGALSASGPGSTAVSYALMGVVTYFVMTSLGEMSTYMPTSGAFSTYTDKFVEPAFGFSIGWVYWYMGALCIADELVAGVLIVQYWFPNVNQPLLCLGFILLILVLNLFTAKLFGEAEFWFALLKVVAIVAFLVTGLLLILGVVGGEPSPGFKNWTVGDAPFVGGVSSFMSAMIIASFAYRGVEYLGVAAGECLNPQEVMPKTIKTVFWRILIFYIGTIIVIGFLIPYDDPSLLKSGITNIAASPFTMIFEKTGFGGAATVMNIVILTSILSACNALTYTSSRVLYSMAKVNNAPKIFAKTSKNGIPVAALIVLMAIAALCFLASTIGASTLYMMLLNGVSICGCLAWMAISFSHFRFRRAYVAQGRDLAELGYKAKFFPVGDIISLLVVGGSIIGLFITSGSTHTVFSFLMEASGIILFLILYLGYKIKNKSKFRKLTEVDLSTDDIKLD
ncbi:Lysine-specific permease [uncultured Eubacterium sp.]|uniref:amino acid permease n=1 Tax=Brotomerdimonas butyrica TaxID=2981721 RepID=UPI00082134B5|nr:amino acid permease [Brotomerdimonas butyrica]MCU6754684.1 amino acid permease [Brotomerdimonas butyrica]SCG90703.1 Lysine-specific permease [uncultured Eubacterium sp.]